MTLTEESCYFQPKISLLDRQRHFNAKTGHGVADAPAEGTIVKGILIVMQERGSRNEYDSRTDKFWLIGVDLADRDRATAFRNT